jgi:alpha/beta superfamily hydrolase
MRRPELEGFIAVSPPANLYDFTFLSPCPAAGLITQGDRDDIVSEESVSKLAQKLSTQKNANLQYNVVSGADHYYRNNIEELNTIMDDYIKRRMSEFVQKRKVRPDRKRRQLPRD